MEQFSNGYPGLRDRSRPHYPLVTGRGLTFGSQIEERRQLDHNFIKSRTVWSKSHGRQRRPLRYRLRGAPAVRGGKSSATVTLGQPTSSARATDTCRHRRVSFLQGEVRKSPRRPLPQSRALSLSLSRLLARWRRTRLRGRRRSPVANGRDLRLGFRFSLLVISCFPYLRAFSDSEARR